MAHRDNRPAQATNTLAPPVIGDFFSIHSKKVTPEYSGRLRIASSAREAHYFGRNYSIPCINLTNESQPRNQVSLTALLVEQTADEECQKLTKQAIEMTFSD